MNDTVEGRRRVTVSKTERLATEGDDGPTDHSKQIGRSRCREGASVKEERGVLDESVVEIGDGGRAGGARSGEGHLASERSEHAR